MQQLYLLPCTKLPFGRYKVGFVCTLCNIPQSTLCIVCYKLCFVCIKMHLGCYSVHIRWQVYFVRSKWMSQSTLCTRCCSIHFGWIIICYKCICWPDTQSHQHIVFTFWSVSRKCWGHILLWWTDRMWIVKCVTYLLNFVFFSDKKHVMDTCFWNTH